ncbi:hypothetical protein F4810DRAFT_696194 [Camillea tinctor]|nr:hypothetical protein F4810DRAFT_696194 [Camillea tinctor]
MRRPSTTQRGSKKHGRPIQKAKAKLNPEAAEFTTQGIMLSSPLSQAASGEGSGLTSPSHSTTLGSPSINYNFQSYDNYRQGERKHTSRRHRHSSLSNLLEISQDEQGRDEGPSSAPQARRSAMFGSLSTVSPSQPLGSSSSPAQVQESEREDKLKEKQKKRSLLTPLEQHREREEDARGFSDDDEFFIEPE